MVDHDTTVTAQFIRVPPAPQPIVAGEIETTLLGVEHLMVLAGTRCACGERVGPRQPARLWSSSDSPLPVYVIRCTACGLHKPPPPMPWAQEPS